MTPYSLPGSIPFSLTAKVRVCASGYEWRDIKFGEWVRTESSPSREGMRTTGGERILQPRDFQSYRFYDPFKEEPALFQTFVEIETTEKGIAEFASRYGDLHFPTESVEQWKSDVFLMRGAMCVWRAVLHDDKKLLAKLLTWEKAKLKILVRNFPYRNAIVEAVCAGRYTRGDLIEPAKRLLSAMIAAGFRLESGFDSVIIAPQVTSTGKLYLECKVEKLLTVLWIQFAAAVCLDKSYNTCKECGRAFEKSASRIDRQFCGGACRAKAMRTRRAQAREMYGQGKTVKEVAELLGSELKTVKRWLAAK